MTGLHLTSGRGLGVKRGDTVAVREQMYRPRGISDGAWRAIVTARAVADAKFAAAEPPNHRRSETLIHTIVKPVFFAFAAQLRHAVTEGSVAAGTVDDHLSEFRRVLCVELFFKFGGLGGSPDMFGQEVFAMIRRSPEWRVHLDEFA